MNGVEWIVEAFECSARLLSDAGALQALFDRAVTELRLRPVEPPLWHVFPEPGGITGMLLLAESHLTVHTFPETGFAALNLYCCRAREPWPFEERLREHLRAERVSVRELKRP